ncbi:chromosome segregation protein SMC [Mobilicoccus pelagius]|uniref:Chromosome partition protein Smc n=1 Tax=Mobilicoccus pelagius NBRC 104925 TaxID=1089455 RepID=H5UND8_9MICO|nr:chromosome segregation protein SMC [Mobilicoccus pelagius]GAB47246.1 chromosome partition protein SMC [Mobilicoccus pelagius NBRC 104925]
MYVKSLSLKGFKSFASATHLQLEPGITCIVGPNGSGKSNVVDALAWVMGEQGAKSLRGGKMEDVIFAGTSGRPPLGRAEVTMTIDNSDGALPIEYTEVTISRTMFRTGGSEYAINGTGCRLLDIQELLSDSGIGREMHVIVGQGQLDAVLRATPEERRGFVEEAAGVLKHRKRKERALRKLETMEGNLRRVQDLTSEIRRQLGPLGRQAETARRAGVVQAEARDARLRLLADDLVQMTTSFEADVADERAQIEAREAAEAELVAVRARLAEAEAKAEALRTTHAEAQERWFTLSSLRDRLTATGSLAAERVRLLSEPEPEDTSRGRDPETLLEQAKAVRADEAALAAEIEDARTALADAVRGREEAERAAKEEQDRLTRQVRAAADRREGLAKLAGKVAAARSRIEAGEAELGRLQTSAERARAGAEEAQREFAVLEAGVADEEEGEEGLDAAYEEAAAAVEAARAVVEEAQEAERAAEADRAHAAARREALAMGLARADGAEVLLERGVEGVLGRIAQFVTVATGRETAVAAALGRAADGLAVSSLAEGGAALRSLSGGEAGAASLLVAGETPPSTGTRPAAESLAADAVWALDVVTCDAGLRPAVEHLLAGVLLVEDLDAALDVHAAHPDVTAVTRAGDVVAPGLLHGGGQSQPSLIEVEAAVEEASAAEREAEARRDQARFALASGRATLETLEEAEEAALADLHASDARLAGVAEQLGRLASQARSAKAEADRITASAEAVRTGIEENRARLAELEQRHADAAAAAGEDDAEPSTEERDRLAEAAAACRAAETEARLRLRSREERIRSLTGRAEGLENAARQERAARAQAEERRRHRQAQVALAREVQEGAEKAARLVGRSVDIALARRDEAAAARTGLEEELTGTRSTVESLTARVRDLTDSVHRDEIARAEQRLRIDALRARAVEELGIDHDVLVEEFGPHRRIPEITPELITARMEEEARERAAARVAAAAARENGSDTFDASEEGGDSSSTERSTEAAEGAEDAAAPETDGTPAEKGRRTPSLPPLTPVPDEEGAPFVREQQEKRLRKAERDLARLGRINPLALEEFAALEERHTFLTEQTDDLKRSRDDLLDIVKEVDARVEQAFADAFADTAREFEGVFGRLFPGGEGRLTLTDPSDMLTTGIEVEARPPGKKIKRLSLLSGGERSLTAVALLVAIFKARPSPFYIMDEVEAALDDTNLGRLLTIFEELRDSSQLIVITHQKRTMEVADALYGVTMRGDGITTVVSQRVDQPA